MTALPFYAGTVSRGLIPRPRPLLCCRAKHAMYATHREFGTFGNIKELSLSLLARLVVIGKFRRVPNSPKCANKCVWTPWRTSAV